MKIAGPAADSDDYQPTYGAEDTEAGKGAGRILDLDAPRRKSERVMKVLTDKATQWLEAQPKDRPFFLCFTPVAVHNPVTPDKDLASRSGAGPFGDWTVRDGGVWAAPKAPADKPAQLKAAVEFAQGTIDFEVNLKGSHAVLAEPKTALSFLVFGESAGFRNVRITR